MAVNRLKNSGTSALGPRGRDEGRKEGKRRMNGGREGESQEMEGAGKKRALALGPAFSLVVLTSSVVFSKSLAGSKPDVAL